MDKARRRVIKQKLQQREQNKLARIQARTAGVVPVVIKTAIADTLNCVYRSKDFNPEWCSPCKRSIKVFGCEIYGKCTIGKKLEGIACCNNKGEVCPDYQSFPV